MNGSIEILVPANLDDDGLDDLVICNLAFGTSGVVVVFGDVIADALVDGQPIDIEVAVTTGAAVRLDNSPGLDTLSCENSVAVAGDVDGDGEKTTFS